MHCQSSDPAARRARQWGAPSQQRHRSLSAGSEGLMNDYFSLCNTTGCRFIGHPAPHHLTFWAEYPQWSKLGGGPSAPKWNKTSTLLLDGDLWDLASTWDSEGCLIDGWLKQDSCSKQFIVFMHKCEQFSLVLSINIMHRECRNVAWYESSPLLQIESQRHLNMLFNTLSPPDYSVQ